MKKEIVVIIPVHMAKPSAMEMVSLRQCRKVLIEYDVYLVAPQGLDVSFYKEAYPELQLQEVPVRWMNSREAYNRMKKSLPFYLLFEAYSYMLTYELDSYIFSDDWDTAQTFSYDYIGAPWFEGWMDINETSQLKGVGNSGFSMRNIRKCVEVLRSLQALRPWWMIFRYLFLYKFFRFSRIAHQFNSFWKAGSPNPFFFTTYGSWHSNEDEFWGGIAPAIGQFMVATIEDAVKFSFEVNPAVLYQYNHYHLPIGCHAWERFDPQFWNPYIPISLADESNLRS